MGESGSNVWLMNAGSMKVVANYLLWRVGVRQVLPSRYVQRIPVEECGEPIVPLVVDDKVVLDHRIGTQHQLREGVARALTAAAGSLPEGYKLMIVEGYRSLARQRECWEQERRAVAAQHPDASSDEVDRLTSLIVANPSNNNTGGHQTGAAVDLTLADANGREIWMGTGVQKFDSATPTAASPNRDVESRRAVLCASMTGAGFVNYPGEWWHFSLGDRLWAAYRRQSMARYGPV